MSRIVTEPLFSGEKRVVPFDFTSQLAVGETISSIATASVVYSGTDLTPTIVSGSPTSSGAIVSVTITGGTVGVIYELLVTVTSSLGNLLPISTYIAFVPNLI